MKKLLLIPLLFLSFVRAETIQCKVIGVTDGDYHAPEAGQAYGQKAKQKLSDMIYGEDEIIETHGTDIDSEIFKEIDLCVNFPTKLNPDGCSSRNKSN